MSVTNSSSFKLYIHNKVEEFHQKRLKGLETLRLSQVLKRKNPYLFRTKNIITAEDLVRSILSSHLSSQEEGIFGLLLEDIAIRISSIAYGGMKSGIEGIDLEFSKDNVRYLVSIKSGPNWGNSSQIRKLKDYFIKAKRILRQNKEITQLEAINGCCYGKCNSDYGDYMKICGQDFWSLISGEDDLFIKLIKPFGEKAKEKCDRFETEYAKTINVFSRELLNEFCHKDGEIDWIKLLKFNSGRKK